MNLRSENVPETEGTQIKIITLSVIFFLKALFFCTLKQVNYKRMIESN